MEFVVICALGVGLYFFVRQLRGSEQKSFSESATRFSSNGVVVDYETGEIIIRGYRTHANKVSGTRSETEKDARGLITRYNSCAYIKLDDMNKPIHKIKMVGEHTAEQFLERFRLALEKAGGPRLV